MAGLSDLLTTTANAVNGYNNQAYTNALRNDQELKMQAAQQTYQPAANAQIAQSGLSQAQAQGNASLVPQQTQVASTNLGTQQSAADAALARQPTVNQTADNQATVAAGTAQTQADLLPQAQADTKLAQLSQNQQAALRSTAGLYGAMMNGSDSVRAYVQQEADSGAYPELSGKKIGQVGLTPDGQNFVAQDDQGNVLVNTPVSHIQQAYQMTMPTKFIEGKPGSTLFATQGTRVIGQTQAPVPDGWKNMHQPAVVQTADWISKNVTNGDSAKALEMAKAASTMSRANFVANMAGKYAMPGQQDKAGALAEQMGQVYDNIQRQGGGAPGLSTVGGSNSGGPSIIDSLIGNPTAATDNPYAPDQ